MKGNSRASYLARTFASPYLGRELKVKVGTKTMLTEIKPISDYYIPQDQTPYTLTKCLKCNNKKIIVSTTFQNESGQR
jgi:hypothetical protein